MLNIHEIHRSFIKTSQLKWQKINAALCIIQMTHWMMSATSLEAAFNYLQGHKTLFYNYRGLIINMLTELLLISILVRL